MIPSTTLGWFPPAPAEGPLSILTLPPDDWACEVKIDGARAIVQDGQAFTRQGSLLSAPKGRDRILSILASVPVPTLEGEWVLKDDRL